MRFPTPLPIALSLPAAVSAVLALTSIGCQGTFGAETGRDAHAEGEDVAQTPVPACPIDPDCSIGGDCSLYECPDYWLCEDLASETEGKRCTNPGPDYPDNSGNWDCEQQGSSVVCTGGDYPDNGGGGDWNCERQNDVEVVCTDDNPDYPDLPGGGTWNCYFRDEFRICESGDVPGDGGGWFCYDTPDGRECRQRNPDHPDDYDWDCHDNAGTETVCSRPGDYPGDGGGGDWLCERMGDLTVCADDDPDYPDEPGEGGWHCYYQDEFRICEDGGGPPDGGDSECVAGAQRWCDDAIYCSWGKQTCLPDGTWGRCVEPVVSSRTGLPDRPATECGCRYFYFNEDCCEDQADRDGDGHADCVIPDGHTVPACESDGSACSYCDVAAGCGGADDLCLFDRGGYAFCGQSCSNDSDCDAGYSCTQITTSSGRVNQCTPRSGTCD